MDSPGVGVAFGADVVSSVFCPDTATGDAIAAPENSSTLQFTDDEPSVPANVIVVLPAVQLGALNINADSSPVLTLDCALFNVQVLPCESDTVGTDAVLTRTTATNSDPAVTFIVTDGVPTPEFVTISDEICTRAIAILSSPQEIYIAGSLRDKSKTF
jgi:hypothetical protein